MGACGSSEGQGDQDKEAVDREKRLNKLINSNMGESKQKEDEVLKLLLLGAGESGKSTLFKQIIQLYGKGFNDEARASYAQIIYMNCIFSIQTLIEQSKQLDPTLGCGYDESIEPSAAFLREVKQDAEVNAEIARHIKVVWADPGIQRTYEFRAYFQLLDQCKYFFERVDAIATDNYLPSYDDVLRCRVRTTGIVETHFEIQGSKFRMLDVGGQRSERKKWFHCFEEVTAVIFVAAMNEYDQLLYEDNETNRMMESLALFQEISNSRWFNKTAVILFLNKSDLFAEKIQRVDLRCCFNDYYGGCNYDLAANFIKDQFLAKNEFPDKKIYWHITCATNTENVSFTFSACKDIIVKTGLRESGLLL